MSRGERWPGDKLGFREGIPARLSTAVEPVPVSVRHVAPGVWCRVTGHDDAGNLLTISGAIVAGPDIDGEIVAVQIRDYRGNPDVVVYVPAGGFVELTDDPADHAARAAWAIAPVYAPGAARVEIKRRPPGPPAPPLRPGGKRPFEPDWITETHYEVSADQLAEWENGHSTVVIVSVHRHPLPITRPT